MTPQLAPVQLTPEERNLLYLAATGHSPAQTAQVMNLPLPRTRILLAGLQRRCGVATRNALIARAIVRRWI